MAEARRTTDAPATLTAAQESALRRIRAAGDRERGRALGRLLGHGVTEEDAERLCGLLRGHARVTLNFHPDRLLADHRGTVADRLAADGRYRGQYETGLSNGSRSAHPGGLRDSWEERLFGGAYTGAAARERPKYGALNLMRHADGAAPRFGSCHVRLRPEVSGRATFCFGDSHVGPKDLGTIDAFLPVLAALVTDAAASGQSLGVAGADPVAEIGALAEAAAARPVGRALDHYVEAQVHGDVDLARDAEAIVVDPSFRGTGTAELLASLGVPVEWHSGFVLRPAGRDDELAAFRGPLMPPFAARVADEFGADGAVDAATVGLAAASALRSPGKWAAYGTPDEVLQLVKQVWHCLVEFGDTGSRATGFRATG
ncbi:DUF3626 domain-containing protein [Streptomyces beihaiensis]|uniref:DUF3626 domain-containing protein n=1 Tax=Streptomyces beihaiensis TaxID=2984495 RepID=A0ABT3U3H0_9ACTN|nr:DUF3626 domain-containing protein [Streptomyces beihaiensis]MCX3063846.1 DUF3626 domain-containing protein [Streptomyces beihaiensis]